MSEAENTTSAEMKKLLEWVQKEIVDPFDDEEIMGEHRVIVDLYNEVRRQEQQIAEWRRVLEDIVNEEVKWPADEARAALSKYPKAA